MPVVVPAPVSLDAAVARTRTGDLWLFRGRAPADRMIQVTTGSPVNHVGMAVVLDDLPPLLWHADAGAPLPDRWSGTLHGGAQLHDLRAAVVSWARRYGQDAWFRLLDHQVDRAAEDAILRTIARLDGTPYPSPVRLGLGWLRERARPTPRRTQLPSGARRPVDCAQLVALTYRAMGLLPATHGSAWYDPGRFWSGAGLRLGRGARLSGEVPVRVPPRDPARARAL
jgi:hypothetical protein